MTQKIDGDAIALGFSFRTILDKEGRREIVFQSHVPVTASADEINNTLDKVRTATDRQAAIYELRQSKLDLDGHLAKIREIEAQLGAQEETYKTKWEAEGRRGHWTPENLPATERHAKAAIMQSLQKYRDGAIILDSEVKRLEAVVYGNASHIGSNRHTGNADS